MLMPFIEEHRDFREMLANEIESLDELHAMQKSQLEIFTQELENYVLERDNINDCNDGD